MLRAAILVPLLAALLVGAPLLFASDGSSVATTATQSITAFGVCKMITNTSPTGKTVYVPTQSAAEWQSFYMHPPAGVTIGACGSICGAFTKENVAQWWNKPASYCDGITEFWWDGITTRVKAGAQIPDGDFAACRNFCQNSGASCCQFIASSNGDWDPNCIAFINSDAISYTYGYFDMEYVSTAALCYQ